MKYKRQVAYVTGTRADFGLMRATLSRINAHSGMNLTIYATGMHLDPSLGNTIVEVEESDLPIVVRLPVETGSPSGALMAANIGHLTVALTRELSKNRPDILLLLGDRGEMLAAAIAAIHQNIPIVHIHGGERSGTVDEPVRHAISKLAHLHLVTTQQSRERLIRMGEREEMVVVVGAPGLDGITVQATRGPGDLFVDHGLDPNKPVAVFLYHPVLQESNFAATTTEMALDALISSELQILALKPNSDSGSGYVLKVLERYEARNAITLVPHLTRHDYLSALRDATMLVGNSSSGIIEAASFGTPVINIGSRQNLRERNSNVIDVEATRSALSAGINRALGVGRLTVRNIYGDGSASTRIVAALRNLNLQDAELMHKINTY